MTSQNVPGSEAVSEAPYLCVRNLVVEYRIGKAMMRAVDDVSFQVAEGATLAIVGESGCGKSTIAKSIVRLLTPTSGQIVVDGTDIAAISERHLRPLRSKIQMIFQDPYGSLDPHLCAADIIAEPLRLRGINSKAQRRAEAARLIDQVGLPASAGQRRPPEFSGGQRQRIGIARALASQPKLLICDEATSALDVSVQAQVLELLRQLQADFGLTYVVISHNLGVVREISEHVVVMQSGRVVESGETAQILSAPTQTYTRALRGAALDPTAMVGRKPRHLLKAAVLPNTEPSVISDPAVSAPVLSASAASRGA